MYLEAFLSLIIGFITGVVVMYHLFSSGELVQTANGTKFQKTKGLITYTFVFVNRRPQ